jgi:isocitrate dehydrogenase
MACHNYDGDMLTDEVAQVHRSPGFITSNLIGKRDDGVLIKEFEASHGTVADLYHMMLRGEETSMNPLGMVVALFGAMDHAATLDATCDQAAVMEYTKHCREAVYAAFQSGKGTRDLCGPSGLTTEQFVDAVAEDINLRMETGVGLKVTEVKQPERVSRFADTAMMEAIDQEAMKNFFSKFDTNGDGSIDFHEFVDMAIELHVAPLKPQVSNDEAAQEQKFQMESMNMPA